MRFEILGPLRITAATETVALTANRDRTLLAMLLLHANRTVPVAQLVEAIWAADPPPGVRNQLQGCVSRLRRRLASAGNPTGLIATEPAGYRTTVAPDQLDLLQFRHHVAEARRTAGETDHTEAINHYRAALALWHGPALADIDSDLIRRAATALDEEHVEVLDERIEFELGIDASPLVAELTDLVGRYPHRESLHRALMLALYRTGRQADALAAYRHARRLLHDELGIEPGTELQRLHQAILNRDPALDTQPRAEFAQAQQAVQPSPIPRELPADVAGFTGRDTALKTLDGMLSQQTGPVVITAIAGTAGVGKTAIAVHWGHQVADRFPDGQLYLNLRGYATDTPVRPIDALAALLRSLGVPPEQIPTDEAQAAALYRTRLADKRVLMVLDNAGTVGQVRPLLPGSPGCLVLITSRDRLAGLVARDGAHRLTLDVLTPEESTTLLTHLLGTERTATEPETTATLANACAHLPLALRIAAAMLLDGPERSIRDYVSELTTSDRLAMLQADGDEASAVRATFELSYQRLPAAARRLFRLLGLVPGADFTAPAAAALAGTTQEQTEQLLTILASAHLVEQHQPGRYTFHDLLRLYAQERAEHEEDQPARRDAVDRLLGWYLVGIAAASDLLYPDVLRLPIGSQESAMRGSKLEDSNSALSWLEAERTNLATAVLHAADHGPRRFAWLLADRLRRFLWVQRYPADALSVLTAACTAAERAGDLPAQAVMNLGLGAAHQALGHYSRAIECFATAAELASCAEWQEVEAGALANLGGVQLVSGEVQGAEVRLSRAIALYRRTGQRHREAVVLGTLGHLHRQMGRLERAADCCVQQIAIYREVDSGGQESLALSLANLGAAKLDLGQLDRASEHLSAALQLHKEVGGRYGEAYALESLAATHLAAGRLGAARDLAQAALRLAGEIGDPRAEVEAVNTVGSVACQLGTLWSAVEHHERAAEKARQTRCPDLEVSALIGLATAHLRLDRHDEATGHGLKALESARTIGYRVHEGNALVVLAEIRLAQGRYDDAGDYARQAVDNHRETGHRLGEAHALAALGLALYRTRDPRAQQHREAAQHLFNEIGAPVPPELATMA